ncbi:unnamed protein product [Albugo candida]|uniref:Uncharacterized protein n=1 Tax=Albugo candida TaxID=65357 RepID=A0A024GKN7_9STRA|nr:unnamed protein product [Albugo candida]|eukprot:CCI47411.1 unnamed protein product [Albugo candida]
MTSSVDSQIIIHKLTQYIRFKSDSETSIKDVFRDIQRDHSTELESADFNFFLQKIGIIKCPHTDLLASSLHAEAQELISKQSMKLGHCMSVISGRQSSTITMSEFCSFFARQLRSKTSSSAYDKPQHPRTLIDSPTISRASMRRKRKPTSIAPLESLNTLAEIEANKISEPKHSPRESSLLSQTDFAHSNPLSEAKFPWRVFHIDSSTTLPYAILHSDDILRRDNDTLRFLNDFETTPLDRQKYEYRFTICIDIWQTIESIRSFLAPLLSRFPGGKILICGFPTQRDSSLYAATEDVLASWYAKLLIHLMDTSREWLVQPKDGTGRVNQYLIGVGSGAAVVIALLTKVSVKEFTSLRVFVGALSAAMVVNWSFGTSECKVASTIAIQKRSEEPTHLHTLHFSSWPHFLPLVIVHGEKNSVVPPKEVHHFIRKVKYKESQLDACISNAWRMSKLCDDSIRPPADLFLHISWLPCGHKALEECPNEMYDLFVKLIHLDKEQTFQEGDTEHAAKHCFMETTDDEIEQDIVLEPRVVDLMQKNGIKWVQQELYNRGADGRGSTDKILLLYQRILRSEEDSRTSADANERIRSEKCFQRQANRAMRLEEVSMRIQMRKRVEVEKSRKQYQSDVNVMRAYVNERTMQQRLKKEREEMSIEDAVAARMRREWKIEDRHKASNALAVAQMREIQLDRHHKQMEVIQLEDEKKILGLQYAQRRIPLEAQFTYQKRLSQLGRLKLPDAPNTINCLPDIEALSLRAEALIEAFDQLQHAIKEHVTLKINVIERLNLTHTNMPKISKTKKTVEMHSYLSQVQAHEKEVSLIDLVLRKINIAICETKHAADTMTNLLKQGLKVCDFSIANVKSDCRNVENERHILSLQRDSTCAKIEMLEDEYWRCVRCDANFFDSVTRSHGSCQRFGRRALLKQLESDIELEKGVLADLNMTMETQWRQLMEKEKRRETWRDKRTLLEECLDKTEKRMRCPHLPGTVMGAKEGMPGRHGGSLAEQIRCKPHAHRNLEERQWLALDYKLYPVYYRSCMDAPSLELIQNHEDYSFKSFGFTFTVQELRRIASLPSLPNLATAFLKCPKELHAHYLLYKFTHEDGEVSNSEAERFIKASSSSRPIYHIARSLDMLERILKETTEQPNTLRYAAGHRVIYTKYVTKMTLLKFTNIQLQPRQIVTHSFDLSSQDRGNAALDLTVTILFHGHFAKNTYENGRIVAMLQVIPGGEGRKSDEGKERADEPMSIGKCSSKDITLSTVDTMGKLIIRYDPITKPLYDAYGTIYQVVVGAPLLITYSVEIEISEAPYADKALVLEQEAFHSFQRQTPLLNEAIEKLLVSVMLLQCKEKYSRKLLAISEKEVFAAEMAVLNEQNADEIADARVSRLKAAQLEVSFIKACFLYIKREEQLKDIDDLMRNEIRRLAKLQFQRKALEGAILEYQLYLPSVATFLNGKEVTGLDCDHHAESDTVKYAHGTETGTKIMRRKYERAQERLTEKLDRDRDASLTGQTLQTENLKAQIYQNLKPELLKLLEQQLRHCKEDPTFDPFDWKSITEVNAVSLVLDDGSNEIDSRCRKVYCEMQRCKEFEGLGFIDSKVFNDLPQRFPVDVLGIELEKELDQLIESQLRRHENEWLQVFVRSEEQNGKSLRGTTQSAVSSKMAPNTDTKDHSMRLDEETRPQGDEKPRATKKRLKRNDRMTQLGFVPFNDKDSDCLACRNAPCQWKGYKSDLKAHMSRRIQILVDERNRISPFEKTFTVSSRVCISAIKQYYRRDNIANLSEKPTASMRQCDLLIELQSEIKVLEQHLLLHEIDSEFHASFQPLRDEVIGKSSNYFVTRALHGFPQAQEQKTAQKALAREHSALVASLTTQEVLDDILQDMLDGWVFGEHKHPSALGVSSLNAQSPFSLLDLQYSTARNDSDPPKISENGMRVSSPEALEEYVPKEWDAVHRHEQLKLVQPGSRREQSLIEIEQNLKFGLFYLVFMRFRAVALLNKQKRLWTDPFELKTNLKNECEHSGGSNSRNERLQKKRKAAHRAHLFAETRRAKRELGAVKCIQRVYRKHRNS